MANSIFDNFEVVRRGRKTVIREKRDPSPEQARILSDLKDQRRITVVAGPGSGKSTLIEMAAAELNRLGLLGQVNGIMSFNTHISKSLKKAFPKELAQTFDFRTVSSLGDLIVRQQCPGIEFDPKKYEKLAGEAVEELCSEYGIKRPQQRELTQRLNSCLDLHVGHDLGQRLSLEDWSARMTLVDAPISGAERTLYTLTHQVLERGLGMLTSGPGPDYFRGFLDQTLAPATFGWELAEKYDVLFIDELQDLSRAQLGLIQSSIHEDTRLIGVGDPRQSLYAFSGADQSAMQQFSELFGATEYPLSVSFRCPVRVVEVARSLFPTLQAAPGAKMGTAEDISADTFLEIARPGDLAIARTNAPLVSWCYQLIGAGIPAMVRGKDVSKTLQAMAYDAACFIDGRVQREQFRESTPLDVFEKRLHAYTTFLIERAEAEAEKNGDDPGMRVMTLADRNQALMVVRMETQARNTGGLISDIKRLFTGSPEDSVLLTTAHGAKGLEADTVFILEAQLFPCEKAVSDSELYAEQCAEYVAYSRAKKAMYFVAPQQGQLQQSKIPEHARGREGDGTVFNTGAFDHITANA